MEPKERFRVAAWAYLGYGVIYFCGAVYLVNQGAGTRTVEGLGTVFFFAFGLAILLVFPWLISRGARGAGYLWFTRILAVLVAYRAFEVARIALKSRPVEIVFSLGLDISMSQATWLFFALTLATSMTLAWASAPWNQQSKQSS